MAIDNSTDICDSDDMFIPSIVSRPNRLSINLYPQPEKILKRNLCATLLVLLVTSPLLQADTNYAGPTYGQLSVDDQDTSFNVETGNLGLVIGGIADSGMGFELFYNFTVSENDIVVDGAEIAEATIISYGVLGVFKSPGQVYVKGKAGFAVAELDFDIDGASGSFDDDASGIAYGVAVGVQIGTGALELTYLVLPEFKDFDGLDFDAKVSLINLGYHWNF